MRALLVDDEPLALIGMQKMLEGEVSDIEIAATYSNPREVIEGVLVHRPDVVFLDVDMPEIDGLELGKKIQAVMPGTELIFVTAYNQYAVCAFELNALDYMVKPIQRSRLRQTILRLQEKLSLKGQLNPQDAHSPLICCFDQIRFSPAGAKPQTAKWRTGKGQELFAYLLHHKAQAVSRSVLLELLWPEIEEAKAAQQLYTTIYHIRQTLKSCGMDSVSILAGDREAGYRLDIAGARVDTEVWENKMKLLGALDAGSVTAYERVLQMYEGEYLGHYSYIWAVHERERLHWLWLHHMREVSEFYERHDRLDKAIQLNQRIQLIAPDEEESYFSLMKIYDAVGSRIGVEEQYRLLQAKIERELELPISAPIADWYEQWKARSGT